MIDIFTEEIFLDRVHSGESFSPSRQVLVVLESGYIELETNEKSVLHQKGNVIALIPGQFYKVINYSDKMKAFFIVIEREGLNKKITFVFNKYELLKTLYNTENKLENLNEEIFYNILLLCKQLHYYSNKNIPFNENIKLALFTSLVYIMVGELLSNANMATNPLVNSRKEEITIDFLHLVSKYVAKERELKFYASKLHLSPKYLSNTIREVTGQPPTHFISEAILNQAKLSLLNSNISIKEISGQLYFSDQYAFGKFFKSHTNLSPSHFRKKNRIVESI